MAYVRTDGEESIRITINLTKLIQTIAAINKHLYSFFSSSNQQHSAAPAVGPDGFRECGLKFPTAVRCSSPLPEQSRKVCVLNY